MDVKSPQGLARQDQDAADAGGAGEVLSEDGGRRAPCKEVIRARGILASRFSGAEVLAERWRTFHHAAVRDTRDPRTGKRNVGMYRMQVYDAQTTGMHWQRQKVAAEHYRERMRAAAVRAPVRKASSARRWTSWRDSGRRFAHRRWRYSPSGKMEVAVAIGTDPALTFSAIVPAPPEVEEYHDCRIPSSEAGGTGEVRDGGSGSSRERRRLCSKAM